MKQITPAQVVDVILSNPQLAKKNFVSKLKGTKTLGDHQNSMTKNGREIWKI